MKTQYDLISLAQGVAALIAMATLSLALATALRPAHAADAKAATAPAAKPAANAAQVLRGNYLVPTSACMDCHTPLKMGANGPEPDMSRMLSGHPEGLQMPAVPVLPQGPWMVVSSATNTAWAGPWGVSFTANLTPDPETGLGQWSVNDFKQTIRSGRHLGRGRAVLPPMPIPAYSQFNDADLEAIFAYLKSIPPVKNKVPEPWTPK